MLALFSLFLPTLLAALTVQGAVLRNYQLHQPVIVPKDAKQCTVKVLQRDFAFSYGSPEIVQLAPPTDCGPPGSWAAVTLNLTVTSNGTQYDRLGIFTFQNVEIWRTSTPEPTRGDGIIWTYVKDVTKYISLFAKPGTFIFQLDNIVQPGLDGVYATQVHATFYAASPSHPTAKQANSIIPLSTGLNNSGNHASVPPGFSKNVTLPRNTVKLYAELYASGNAQEEFWYFNVPNQYLPSLPDGTTYGQGPFREVRLLIDGRVAGLAFPYITFFTGAWVPNAWRPISSYGALDLPTYYLDLTAFIPILADGQPHTFTIDVASAEEDHTILQNWYVSGLLQVFTDSSSEPTTGNITSYRVEPFATTRTSANAGENGDIDITVAASHRVHVESVIKSGSGKTTRVVWDQSLDFKNVQSYSEGTLVQSLDQLSNGAVLSLHNGLPVVQDIFSYPVAIDFRSFNPEFSFYTAKFDQRYNRRLLPAPFLLGSTISNHQIAEGYYQRSTTGGPSTGNGTSNNTFNYIDDRGNTYRRRANAALFNITLDVESGSLAPIGDQFAPTQRGGPISIEGDGQARLPGGRGSAN